MRKLFLVLVLTPCLAFAVGGSFDASNNIIGQGDGTYVNITGDTMTGPLTLSGSTLTVTGNAFSVAGSITMSAAAANTGYGMQLKTGVGLNVFSDSGISLNHGGGEAIRIVNTSGNVGIGTTGPGQKLDIQNGGLAISSWTSSGSSLFVSSTTGKVGIGTTGPATKWHLSSGTITLDGTGSITKGYSVCFSSTTSALGVCKNPDADGLCAWCN